MLSTETDWRKNLSDSDEIRLTVLRSVLEFQRAELGGLPISDGHFVGDYLPRLVSSADGEIGGSFGFGSLIFKIGMFCMENLGFCEVVGVLAAV